MKRLWLGVAVMAAIGCGGSSGTDGGTTGTDSGSTPAPTCAAYCAAVHNTCNGNTMPVAPETPKPDTQYGTGGSDFCMTTCAAFPLGNAGDTTQNTIGCRMYHASVAGAAPANLDPHCWHAGPAGFYDDSGCGASSCESFCMIVNHACTGAAGSATANPYGTMAACMTMCPTFAGIDETSGAQPSVDYNADATSGNSLACRLYHATAATMDPATHCAHAGPVSTGVCM